MDGRIEGRKEGGREKWMSGVSNTSFLLDFFFSCCDSTQVGSDFTAVSLLNQSKMHHDLNVFCVAEVPRDQTLLPAPTGELHFSNVTASSA